MAPIATTLLVLTLAALPVRDAPDTPEAPDGRRGLGSDTELSELLKVLGGRRDEERDFVAGLLALEGDVHERLETLRGTYAARDYFDLVPLEVEPTVAALHDAFLEASERPLHALAREDAASRAFARMFLDTRFRARLAVIGGWEVEAREVEAGIWVLRGMTDGWVVLTPEEARGIAMRVDLSASLLRALRNDLDVLRPARGQVVSDSAVAMLLVRAHAADEEARRAELVEFTAEAARKEELMVSALFSARLGLEPDVIAALDWRRRLWARAEPLRAEALQFLPDTPQGRAAPANVAEMKRHERLQWAGRRGREGLAIDPLDQDLVFAAAHASDFLWGSIQALEYYDRYLALRRIRAHEHETIRGRDLTDWETEALFAVQRSVLAEESPGLGR